MNQEASASKHMKELKICDEQIISLSRICLKLSIEYVKKMQDGGQQSEDDLAHLNKMKKHLSFIKKTRNEISMLMGGGDLRKQLRPPGLNHDTLEQIKKLESSIGKIVRQIPHG